LSFKGDELDMMIKK